jgi:hypothetical protein
MSIAPTIEAGRVALEFDVVARTAEEAFDLVKALQARRDFAEVFPTGLDQDEEGIKLGISLRFIPEGRVPAPLRGSR